MRRVSLMYLVVVAACGSPALGQIRGDLTESGSNNTGLSLTVNADTSAYGAIGGTGGHGATMSGQALVVLFPETVPFADVAVRSWSAAVEETEVSLELGTELGIDVTLVALEFSLTGPVQGGFGDFGPTANFEVESADFAYRATIHVVGESLGLDAVVQEEGIIEAPFRGRLVLAAGDLFLGFTAPPELVLHADPSDLPAGVATMDVTIVLDAGNTNYRGPAESALRGDSDLDDDVDLNDHAFRVSCENDDSDAMCLLHDFDGDGTLTLQDFAAFQHTFTGS